jgi:hypothetical protein
MLPSQSKVIDQNTFKNIFVKAKRETGTAGFKNVIRGTKSYEKSKEYPNYHLLRAIWWSKFSLFFKCCLFFHQYSKINIYGLLKMVIFLHRFKKDT